MQTKKKCKSPATLEVTAIKIVGSTRTHVHARPRAEGSPWGQVVFVAATCLSSEFAQTHGHTSTPVAVLPTAAGDAAPLGHTRSVRPSSCPRFFFFFFFITQRLLKAPVTRLGVSSSARHGLPEAHRPSVESTFLRPCIPEAQFFSCQSVPRTPQEPARPRPHVSSAFGAPGPAPCAGRHTGSARFLAGKHYGGCLTRCRSAGRGRSGRQ